MRALIGRDDIVAPGLLDEKPGKLIIPDGIDGPFVARALEGGSDERTGVNVNGQKVGLFSSVSGLSPAHQRQAVNLTLQAAVLGYHNRDSMHYTQGSQRWEGIDNNDRAWKGQFPHHADCSAFATWCLFCGLTHFHHTDTVDGQHWHAGYTGTLLEHGRSVGSASNLRPGDLVIYGTSWPGEHTAVYTGGGLVVSFGSEPGPLLLRYNYRGDILSCRRYI